MTLFNAFSISSCTQINKIEENILKKIKTVDDEYIECEINNKKKKWSEYKLAKEFYKYNHNLICLKKYEYNPFKKVCQENFSFLKEGERYYTSNDKLHKRHYKLIFQNLMNSPSIQISFCGIVMTAIAWLVDLKNKKFKKP
ncbi:conserved Plasmodium protein, unknown function [Plasmodium vinckei brucechwatti]|uniref:Uncharacterized protein n=1 Tax=Plasmodium vinckei brucechwatti TaxID=119398 RepID=A0A6V7SAE9_PLAVN|nr:conserved Plasmodium protein, unknown function [Plasmodium vinckei brucechwatti]